MFFFFLFSFNASSLQHFTSTYSLLPFLLKTFVSSIFSSTYTMFNPHKTSIFCVLRTQYSFRSIHIFVLAVTIHSFLLHVDLGSFSFQRTSFCISSENKFSQVVGFFLSFPEKNLYFTYMFERCYTKFKILDWQISFSPLMILHCCPITMLKQLSVLLLLL